MTGVARYGLLTLLPCLLLLAGPAHAQLTGTLFTQPAEREYLDYLRREFLLSSQEAGFDIQVVEIPEIPVEAGAAAEAGPVQVTFGGIMTRRDGSHSIWLDGRLLTEDELPDGMTLITSDRSTSLRIAQGSNIFLLRPGQTVDLDTGTVVENFQRPQPAPPAVEEPAPIPEEPAAEEAASAPEATEASQDAAAEPAATGTEDSASISPASASDRVTTLADAVSQLDETEFEALATELERRELEAANAPP